MGLKEALNARHVCNLAGIPTYTSPEKAVKAFMHMVDYQRVQALLHEIPPSLPFSTSPEIRAECRALIKQAKEQGRQTLTHSETAQVLELTAFLPPPAPMCTRQKRLWWSPSAFRGPRR